MWGYVLGAIGAIIGAVITRTPQGAMAGWAIGSAIGGIGEMVFSGTDTVVTKGPRLSDLKVQTSNYGADIPQIWGNARLAGNIIWAKKLKEERKIRHLDGDAEFWEYRYYANFAVGLCEGEIAGVRRIWLDGKLWMDLSSSLDLGDSTLSSSIQRGKGYRVYPGSETQTIDPTISANLGAANTCAYRGLAYIVFNDLKVENYGNRIPEVTVEVVRNGADADEDWTFEIDEGEGEIALDSDLNLITAGTAGTVNIYDGISSTKLVSFDYSTNCIGIKNDTLFSITGGTYQNKELCKHEGISRGIEWKEDIGLYGYVPKGGMVYYNDTWIFAATSGGSGRYIGINQNGGLEFNLPMFSAYGNHTAVDSGGNLIEKSYSGSLNTHSRRAGLFGGLTDSFQTGQPGSQSMYYERNYDLLIVAAYTYSPNKTQIYVYDGFSSTLKKTGRITESTVYLDDVISDICLETTLTAQDIDVTDLASTSVRGYIRTGQMTARRAIEPLMAAYQFDAAEIDNKLVFIKRGNASIVSIPEDDLSAHESGSDVPDKLNYNRNQEIEIPKEFNVIYMDQERNYQEGTARSIRMTINNTSVSKVELPIVLTPTEGKQIAEIMHNTAYTERVKYSFSTYQKYLYLAPADVITVDGFLMRIKSMSINNGLLDIEAIAESDTNYISAAVSDGSEFEPSTISNEGPSTYQLIDIPILSDHHNNSGFYFAAHGLLSGWVGATLYLANTNQAVAYAMEATPMGYATTALADADVGMWDTTNSVTIQMDLESYTLSSKTQTQVLSQQNWAIIGINGAWEIIGFATVVDNGSGSYTLSTLLRGLKNTHEMTGGHAINDRIIFIDPPNEITPTDEGTLTRYQPQTIGSSIRYKVASLHQDPEVAGSFDFTNNALGLKPYPPTSVEGSRDGSNNLTITWIRASRINNEWNDKIGVPLGEDSEVYEIDIHNTQDGSFGTVVRTYENITSETKIYSIADQTEDFTGARNPVDITVYQISATVDRGYGRQATI